MNGRQGSDEGGGLRATELAAEWAGEWAAYAILLVALLAALWVLVRSRARP